MSKPPPSPLDRYDFYVRGADAHDRRRFDAYLLGYLLNAVDETTREAALVAAAAAVNGAAAS